MLSKFRITEEQEIIKDLPFTGQKNEREERIPVTGVINTKTIKNHSPCAKGR
jgi:hypothetical protein